MNYIRLRHIPALTRSIIEKTTSKKNKQQNKQEQKFRGKN